MQGCRVSVWHIFDYKSGLVKGQIGQDPATNTGGDVDFEFLIIQGLTLKQEQTVNFGGGAFCRALKDGQKPELVVLLALCMSLNCDRQEQTDARKTTRQFPYRLSFHISWPLETAPYFVDQWHLLFGGLKSFSWIINPNKEYP